MNDLRKSVGSAVLTAGLLGIAGTLIAKHTLGKRRHYPLAGRLVVITGGSRGLGLALAREFARHRARLVLVAREPEELESAVRELRQNGTSVQSRVCDVSQRDMVEQCIDSIEGEFGSINVLVNNAGTIMVGPLQDTSVEDVEQVMATNFWGAVYTSLAVLPYMRRRQSGRIVNISSFGGKVPVPHLASYTASKFGLSGFSGAMRAEVIRDGVYVTTVNPGLMRTGSPRHALVKGKHQAEFAWFALGDATPLLSMNTTVAARRIVDATIHGEAELTLGLPAKVGSVLHGIAPGITSEFAALINRILPNPPVAASQLRRGSESESWLTKSFLLAMNRKAEQQFNQLRARR